MMHQRQVFDRFQRWSRPALLGAAVLVYVALMSSGIQILSSSVAPPEGADGAEHQSLDSSAARTLAGIIHDLNNETTRSDDPNLIQIIRENYLEPASSQPYALSLRTDPSDGQAKVVDQFFKNKRNGVFVESGGYDGEFLSNTIFLERFRGWTGLLIEPEPANFKRLRSKHRKALLSHSCLSTRPYPSQFILKQKLFVSEIFDPRNISWDRMMQNFQDNAYKQVQCFPLHSFLVAANLTSVDYFSLDVEGQELNVLRTVPWNRVDIKVISVEFKHVSEGKEAVKAFMADHGYHPYVDVPDLMGLPSDTLFVRRDLLPISDTASQ